MTNNDELFAPTRAGMASGQGPVLEWAAILTSRPEIKDESADYAQKALMQWWAQSAEVLSRTISDFPESFRTTRFRKEIRFIEAPLASLKPAFDSLQVGEASFHEAMDYVGRNFAWDKERLLRWKDGLESLGALVSWLPTFTRAVDYLNAALSLGREAIDASRKALLHSIQEPCHFLGAPVRADFESRFMEFKNSYVEAYYLLHEDALNIVGGLKSDEIKVDPVLLRNLDLLSSLPHMDKSYVNRVRLLARWVQRNQCNLPVRQILERYPRCYCNFNPSSQQHPADSVAQINSVVREGIESLRALLRRCGHLITAELKSQQVEDPIRQSVAALLGDGPMSPLKPPIIKVLNRIISKYPNEFLAVMRKQKIF